MFLGGCVMYGAHLFGLQELGPDPLGEMADDFSQVSVPMDWDWVQAGGVYAGFPWIKGPVLHRVKLYLILKPSAFCKEKKKKRKGRNNQRLFPKQTHLSSGAVPHQDFPSS
jgi:hypothetical protein